MSRMTIDDFEYLRLIFHRDIMTFDIYQPTAPNMLLLKTKEVISSTRQSESMVNTCEIGDGDILLKGHRII